MIRHFQASVLIVMALLVSHPYASISLLMGPIEVVIFWDAHDQDEDVFLSMDDKEVEGSDDTVMQEESKRDGEEKGKLKMKGKFAGPLSMTGCYLFDSPWQNEILSTQISYEFGRHLAIFHPPQVIS